MAFQHTRFSRSGITDAAVSSYLTFSPLPRNHKDYVAVLFSVALSVPRKSLCKDLPVRKCVALCCPDFPPSEESDEPVCFPAKIGIRKR